jgi:hypothetical protein
MTTVYQTDAAGYYTGTTTADESPLEPGVWLIPAGAVTVEPPLIPIGFRARFSDGEWTLEEVPVVVPQPEPDPVPIPISDRQFFHGLAIWGLVPREEAMEAVKTGFIPTALEQVITQAEAAGMFPAGMTRWDIEIIIAGATTYEFDHPVSGMIGAAFGWTDEQRAGFWDFASGL